MITFNYCDHSLKTKMSGYSFYQYNSSLEKLVLSYRREYKLNTSVCSYSSGKQFATWTSFTLSDL